MSRHQWENDDQAARWALWFFMAAMVIIGLLGRALASPPPVIEPFVSALQPAVVVELEADGGLCLPDEVAPIEPDLTADEWVIIEAALYRCRRSVWLVADPTAMLRLLRHEVALGVPDEARGITLATWCIEGAMRLQGADGGPLRGDYRDGVAMAHGPFQLWPWQREWCGLAEGEADDLLLAAECYWQRVEDRRWERAMGCPDSWRVGEALASHGPRYLPHGCAAESAHWRELRRWEVGR